MARSLRYFVFALGIAAACVSFGNAEPSFGQIVPDAAAPPKTETQPPKIQEVNDAIELFRKRDFDGAVTLLEKAVKAHPDLPPAQVIMFQLFVQANQAGLARMALEKTIITDPKDPEAFVILGNVALQERRVTDADLLYGKAQELLKSFNSSPKRKEILEPQTISGLAAVAEAREQWALAQTDLERLLKLNPKDAFAMQRLARALFQQKDAVGSLTKLKEAKAADKDNVLTPEAALGRFYEQYGDHVNAQKWMTKALAAAPDELRTQLVISQWALETGQIDMAETHGAKALSLDPKSLEAKVLRGVVALFKKDYASAEKYFEDAHLQSPSSFPASNNLALALCEQTGSDKKPDVTKLKRALEYANANYQQNSKSADAASTLGWVLYKAGDLDRAELALRQAASTGNLSADTAYYMAQISYDRGRKDDAKILLDAVLKGTRPFSMRPEAAALLEKLKSEPAPKKEASK